VVPLYIPDVHSPEAAAIMLSLPGPVLVSSLVLLESVNAMHLRVFRKERTVRQSADSIQAFEADISADVMRLLPVPASGWDVARRLSTEHSATLGTRSLDILHVAITILLRADTFLTFDRNQAALARAEGLQTPTSI
jgi:predicted nucleic acid-binding protein